MLTIIALMLGSLVVAMVAAKWIKLDKQKLIEDVARLQKLLQNVDFLTICETLEWLASPEEIEVTSCAYEVETTKNDVQSTNEVRTEMKPIKMTDDVSESESEPSNTTPSILINSIQYWNLPSQERFRILKEMKTNKQNFFPILAANYDKLPGLFRNSYGIKTITFNPLVLVKHIEKLGWRKACDMPKRKRTK